MFAQWTTYFTVGNRLKNHLLTIYVGRKGLRIHQRRSASWKVGGMIAEGDLEITWGTNIKSAGVVDFLQTVDCRTRVFKS